MQETKLSLLKNCTLLLVEDEEELLRNLKVTLELFFGTVLTALNGAEALKIYREKCIDVVMTDYVMPIMDGHRLCQEIRNHNNQTPLLILSNHSDQEKLLSAIPLNLTSYLLKPVNFQELTVALLSVIERMEQDCLLEIPLSKTLTYNKLAKQLQSGNDVIKLAKSEILLLELFLKHQNSIVTHDMIDSELENDKPLSYQATKNLIYRLRKKIGKDSIKSVQSLGYVFCIQPR